MTAFAPDIGINGTRRIFKFGRRHASMNEGFIENAANFQGIIAYGRGLCEPFVLNAYVVLAQQKMDDMKGIDMGKAASPAGQAAHAAQGVIKKFEPQGRCGHDRT